MALKHSEKILALAARMQIAMERKLNNTADFDNFLPEENVDFSELFEQIIPDIVVIPDGEGRAFFRQKEILRYERRGLPEILAVHMLIISYLRRKTPYETLAKRLFFRLWETHCDDLIEIMPTRDLISALRTFADHDDNSERRSIAKLGFVYATTMKIYESERAQDKLPLDQALYKFPTSKPKIGLQNTDGVRFDADNSLNISNILIFEDALNDPVVGFMILSLLVRIYEGETILSRADQARLEAEYKTTKPFNYVGWSWGFNPKIPLSEDDFRL